MRECLPGLAERGCEATACFEPEARADWVDSVVAVSVEYRASGIGVSPFQVDLREIGRDPRAVQAPVLGTARRLRIIDERTVIVVTAG